MGKKNEVELSVVLPVYNEEKNLRKIYKQISQVMSSNYEKWEIIFVDDGSTDSSYRVLRGLYEDDPHVKIIRFRKNFGQSAALSAGFEHAEGNIILTLDADLQNDPKDIPRLVDKLEEGYDCVSGWRKDRKDPIGKRFASWIQTHLSMKTGPEIHDFGCTLKAYRREAIKSINIYGEGHRYIPAKLHKNGYKITEIVVTHRSRKHGKTKYGFNRLFKGFFDLLFSYFWNQFSGRPLHFLGGLGSLFMFFGFLIGLYRIIMKYAFGVSILPHIGQLLLSVALILFGFLVFMFGILAEMLSKIYYEDRKPYVVDKKHGLE
ncbi:MAG: glycosyltransferase family 2 protein [Candidatus Natronoplasma sp.]